MANNFLKDMMKVAGNKYGSIVEEGIKGAEVRGWIDTGSYILNAQLSGSLYKGLPNNKITALAGPEATGKTLFTLGILKNFLDTDPKAVAVYFESESAITKDMMDAHGIDVSRVMVLPCVTVEDFQFQAVKMIDSYLETDEEKRPPMFWALDSLGNLSTGFEMEQAEKGETKSDMGRRAKLIKGVFRVLALKLGQACVPLVVTNHVYLPPGVMYPTATMSGGSGLKYMASNIIYLSKRKEKDGKEVIGNIIHSKMGKARLSKENTVVDVKVTYANGLDKYYGLLELAEKYEIFKKTSTRYETPDGAKVFGKEILRNPEKYFTEDVMNQLEEAAAKEFQYGNMNEEEDVE